MYLANMNWRVVGRPKNTLVGSNKVGQYKGRVVRGRTRSNEVQGRTQARAKQNSNWTQGRDQIEGSRGSLAKVGKEDRIG